MLNEQMRDIDIVTVRLDTLVDAADVHIDTDLPKTERMLDFIKKAKNPYCFRSGNIVVKVGYSDTPITIDNRMESYLRAL